MLLTLRPHPRHQLVAFHRAHDEIVYPEVEPAHHTRPVILLGDQDDRQRPGLLRGPHLRADAQRVEIAQCHRHQRQLVIAAAHRQRGVGRVDQHIHPVVGAQVALDPFGVPHVGIDQQDAAILVVDGVHGAHRIFDGDLLAGTGTRPQLVGQRLEPHQALHPGHQLDVVDRLGQEVVGAGLEPAHAVGGLVERGHHQHRDMAGLAVDLEPRTDLEAVHLGHHHVEQDDVDLALGADRQRFLAGSSRDDVEILSRKPRLEQADIRWNIVDDQHPCRQRPQAPRFEEICPNANEGEA